MAVEITRDKPPKKNNTKDAIRQLRVGESVKTDEILMKTARDYVWAVRAECDPRPDFKVWEKDGSIFIARVA